MNVRQPPSLHQMTISPDFIKAILGFGTALGSWSLGSLAQAVEQVPPWIKSLDTPMIVVGLSYGILHLWRELAKERSARILDRDAFETRMRADADKGEASRKELLNATNTQTNVIRDLVRELRDNGLHKPKDGED